jgi:hypothetical protein
MVPFSRPLVGQWVLNRGRRVVYDAAIGTPIGQILTPEIAGGQRFQLVLTSNL